MHTLIVASLESLVLILLCYSYETSAAIIETETSTAELAQEVHNRATQARIAAKEAALIAEVRLTTISYRTMDKLTLCTHALYLLTGSTALAERRCPSRGHHNRRTRRSTTTDARSSAESARDGRARKGCSRTRRVCSSCMWFVFLFRAALWFGVKCYQRMMADPLLCD